MTERALTSAPAGAHGGDSDAEQPGSPAIRLLEALRHGDDAALLTAIGQSTTIAAENMPWACRGPDEVETALREARELFPGLTFESHTRHVGFGLVIEEARVRDEGAQERLDAAEQTASDRPDDSNDDPDGASGEAADDRPGTALTPYDEEVAARTPVPDPNHPMWDHLPGHRTTALALWHENAVPDQGPIPLDLPVRITIRHDDLQVHEVTLGFPAALWRRALGHEVDPREVSLSQVQSAFIAAPGAGFTTHELASPTLSLADLSTAPDASPVADEPSVAKPPRSRRRRWLPAMLVVLALVLGTGWWVVHSSHAAPSAAATTPSVATDSVATGADAAAAGTVESGAAATGTVDAAQTSSKAPTVTRVHTVTAVHRKPTVTLKSDLAFGFNSSTLSPEAKHAVSAVAKQVRQAGLSGKIYVDGYTDNLGSAAYGTLLSQRRANAVSTYLQSQLLGAPVSIVSAGHGESHPVASNATAAGRKQNRRVTITLPQH